jgi:hypothetical protein
MKRCYFTAEKREAERFAQRLAWKMERKPVFASRSSDAQKRLKPKQTFAAKPDRYSFVSNKKAPITQHDRGF